MSGYKNKRLGDFLGSVPVSSLELETDEITLRCKFNLSYFHVEEASQDFGDWSPDGLCGLLNNLKEYSKFSLEHWKGQRMGSKSGKVLEIYGAFPKNSDLKHPAHVPHQALWGRFRMASAVRLVGFIVPPEYAEKRHAQTQKLFDCNTFYIVYLDAEHRFYKTEKK